ncbi:MAG: hypothetical protein ABJG78_15695 [Cyclobacteriaceae bacterium]
MRLLVISCLLLIGISSLISLPTKPKEKINGVSLVSPPRQIESKKLEELKSINAEWVAVIPYGFSRAGQANVTFDHDRQWWGERTKGTCELIGFAKEKGLKTMLKPHVWVMGEGWTGDYKLSTEQEWKTWERDFSRYILNHARIADSLDVEMFCIGTEYRTPAKERPEFWRSLIGQIRKEYSGRITYAANWDNYMNITWWDEIDYIGIDSYFPLAYGDSPTLEEMKKGWIPLKKELEAFSEKWNRPILFTEYGFQSVKGGAGKHWEVDKAIENVDMEVQSKAYEATFQSLWNESWFAGGFLWKWHLTTRGAERNKTRFTPQGKPASDVIAKWYGKSS